MKPLDLDVFLALGWSPAVRAKLQDVATHKVTRYLVAVDTGGKLSATMFTDKPGAWPANAVALWERPRRLCPRGKTRQAVALVEAGATPYAAAKAAGVDPGAVYRQLQRLESRGVCQCCGQLLPVKTPSAGTTSA